MKWFKCALMVFISTASITGQSPSSGHLLGEPAPMPSGLIGWWKGEGDARDSAGQWHGEVRSVTYAPGIVGKAFRFGDYVSYVNVPSDRSFETLTNATLECWVWNDPDKPFQELVTVSGGHYRLEIDREGKPIFKVGYGDWPETSEFGGFRFQTVAGTEAIPARQWTHVAGTHDGRIAGLYVNGQLVREIAANRQLEDPRAIASLVFINYERGGEVGGLIDEVKVFDRALTHAELWSNFKAGGLGTADAPTLSRISVFFPGEARMRIVGRVGRPVTIQASSNLLDWTTLFTGSNDYGVFDFTDTQAGGFKARFYRAVQD